MARDAYPSDWSRTLRLLPQAISADVLAPTIAFVIISLLGSIENKRHFV